MPAESILDVKLTLAEMTGIEAPNQKLLFKGRLLKVSSLAIVY